MKLNRQQRLSKAQQQKDRWHFSIEKKNTENVPFFVVSVTILIHFFTSCLGDAMKDTEMRVMGKTLHLKGIGHITPFVTWCALIKYLLVEHRQLIKTFQYKATCDEKLNRI